MERLATFHWRTPEPTSVDEELVLFDDGSAWLVVRGSRSLAPAVGTYRASLGEADRRSLLAAGPGPVDFDLLTPPGEALGSLMALADHVATMVRETPEAVATFHAQSLGWRSDGSLAVSLLVVGSGTRAVQFELDPGASAILFSHGGQVQGWSDLPALRAGFATSGASELGGVGRRAVVEPGTVGAIAFEVPAPAGIAAVAIRVGGRLSEAFPDDPLPAQFSLTTADAAVAS